MKQLLVLPFIVFGSYLHAQDTLSLSREECEGVFLKENLLLIAEKLKISQSEALVQQAKLWPNPSFTLDQVNFWATNYQTQGQEIVPPLWGNFGRNQQFGMELEQLILTAGKRKKLMALERVGVDKAGVYFEELLRSLKTEFRSLIAELQYIQGIEAAYREQLTSVAKLTVSFQSQVQKGNISRGEYVRLKALELELTSELNDLKNDRNAVQKELKSLMRLNPLTILVITDKPGTVAGNLSQLRAADLIEQAKSNRQELKLAELEKEYYSKLYAYERAQRVPDLSLKATYDRNGNTMLDFIGFGFSIDLPFFNRNQGNIKYAETGLEIAKIENEFRQLQVENEVVAAYQNLLIASDFMNNIEPGYEQTLDDLLKHYASNFQSRNISMIEFIDFLDAYLDNKKIILDAEKNVSQKLEELNYAVGTEVLQ
ncbi:TolC family protein [Crocinitomicaceae bacterium CZZ-1]|uniref:TolC family protein n=1 Tax=Taishania pollutisoli TaxID=2766479 RepID=A0A8J6PKE1_9FLAO|nr:TolC family protein [Taishania pollutisoli]MBC9812525.1 TolC family protein [Taishania pollutisoli]